MATTKRKVSDTERTEIETQIRELERTEYLVGHNEGTFGSAECCRKVGTGDPAFGTRCEYETVGGSKRSTGPTADKMPGYMRYGPITARRLAADRQHLRELRDRLRGK